MENLPESESLCCVYLVRQDEAVGAEYEHGCVQISPLLSKTGSPSALSPLGSALSITVKHTLRVCNHRDTGWPESCAVLRVVSSPECCPDCDS